MNVVIEGVVLVLLLLLLLEEELLLLELSEELLLLEEELLLLELSVGWLRVALSDFSNATTPDFVPLSPQEEISNAVRHTETTKTNRLIIEPFLSSSVQLNQPLVGCITTNYIPLYLDWI